MATMEPAPADQIPMCRSGIARPGARKAQMLRLAKEGLTKVEIAERAGLPINSVHTAFNLLVHEGSLAEAPPTRRGEHEADRQNRMQLAPLDFIPCTRCGLRGHLAGDPVRCLHGDARAGMWQSRFMGEEGL